MKWKLQGLYKGYKHRGSSDEDRSRTVRLWSQDSTGGLSVANVFFFFFFFFLRWFCRSAATINVFRHGQERAGSSLVLVLALTGNVSYVGIIVPLKFGYIIIRFPYTPSSIYFRGTFYGDCIPFFCTKKQKEAE